MASLSHRHVSYPNPRAIKVQWRTFKHTRHGLFSELTIVALPK